MRHLLGWMARSAEVWSRHQHSGCVWLQSRVFFATVCRSLPSEVLDLLEYLSKPKKFETRHPPHLIFPRKFSCLVEDWLWQVFFHPRYFPSKREARHEVWGCLTSRELLPWVPELIWLWWRPRLAIPNGVKEGSKTLMISRSHGVVPARIGQ